MRLRWAGVCLALTQLFAGLALCAVPALRSVEHTPAPAALPPPGITAVPPAAAGTGLRSVRSLEDQPDEQSGYQVHVIYATPFDGRDLLRDVNGQLRTSVAAFQQWLKAQSGGSTVRMDTHGGSLDITFVRLTRREAVYVESEPYMMGEIAKDLESLGFAHPQKIYAVYFEGGSNRSCGAAASPGRYAGLFLNGTPPGGTPCGVIPMATSESAPGYHEFGMLHEIVHSLGFVPLCAPHRTRTFAHVFDSPTDLMYAGSEPWDPQVLDLGRDDYFRHGRALCPDLARSAFLDPLPESPELPNW